MAALPGVAAGYAAACRYKGEPGDVFLAPGEDGALSAVLLGRRRGPRAMSPSPPESLPSFLPDGTYALASGFDQPFLAALAFELGGHEFTRFRKPKEPRPVRLRVPDGVDGRRVALIAEAIALGRDLIDRPANDLGPDALEVAARELAEAHGATIATIRGDDLLARNLPMIHAVGRAAAEAPRLVDFTWGDPAAPKVTLVGKGVCFDTGGLDIKPSSAMLLMKKDMGGAASALALAAMVMGAKLSVRLRVLVPIVENAIAGNAFRPGDVLQSRKGPTVEVGNTDAEGRLILADALALADEEAPELLFDFATLTGAARVALGPDLPPFYTMSDELAEDIAALATVTNDPGWRMPLWDPLRQAAEEQGGRSLQHLRRLVRRLDHGRAVPAPLRRARRCLGAFRHLRLDAVGQARPPRRRRGADGALPLRAARITLRGAPLSEDRTEAARRDPRLTPARGDLAAASLCGQVAAERYVEGGGLHGRERGSPT